ncbi:uncharacterized protein N7473_005001 [Penicillium subrubescens]|uniref:Pyridoxamine 5'-phosphate oxidase Alr4036 family FMN-binding domain-containing protein n=1 Tax=Penicillium subrubescens TaxID=1316194 RepID=A0A1Q5UHU4_9EURO|nr:uncharacterized protein N7473_005001 [Penicillium subrubescens]KAJ5900931.1 hypothetical protein N7473_005001 [Penicillium subrubescens]OKP12057.1 hypothetical protein PENSUB_2415 [Penicillium subrubescens]
MTLPISKSRAPWRNMLESHLEKTKGYDFTIATVGYDSQERPVPRVRTCGFRGFFPELELHPSGQKDMDQQVEDGGNPYVFESDMLTFTTDVRMEKLEQLESTGNNIEAMFWLKEVMVQWRIKGRAYSIGNPNPGSEKEYGLLPELFEALRVKEDYHGNLSVDARKWTWEKAVTKYFANHSPVMRGSFRNPPPGQPRSQLPSNPDLRLGQKVTDLHDPVARENFRVVLILPEEVEQLDLSDLDDVRRRKWTLVMGEDDEDGPHGQWEEAEFWP